MIEKPTSKATNRHWGRSAMWLAIAILLTVPLVAMQFSDQVGWTVGDFVSAGLLLVTAGLAFEVIARTPLGRTFKIMAATALVAAVLAIWAQGAVGIF